MHAGRRLKFASLQYARARGHDVRIEPVSGDPRDFANDALHAERAMERPERRHRIDDISDGQDPRFE